MPSKQGESKPDEIGSWSEDKLKLLEQYLHAYSIILNSETREKKRLRAYHYIDAFAGSVYPKPKEPKVQSSLAEATLGLWNNEAVIDPETARYISGSPVRALETVPPFDSYWFMEIDSWRLAQLEQLREKFSDKVIHILQGDCNQTLRGSVIATITYKSYQRGMVFLDPYGLQVEWATVQALAEARAFDVFVNFPLSIARLLKRDEPPEQWAVDRINMIMGNSDWIQNLYRSAPATQTSMFGEQDQSVVREKIGAEWLADLYATQLSKVFPNVSKPVIMNNSKNSPLYALFVASHKDKAIKIMNDIAKKYQLQKLSR